MNLAREQLEALAAETGFLAQTLEKVLRLGELSGDIARHPLLSRVLALKGGTALNLLFGPPARLSVDLDFNYVGQTDRARMLEERPEVERAVRVIAEGQGYQVQQSRDAHAGRKLYLSYANVGGTRDRIEVDINFLFRIPVGNVSQRAMWQPPGFEAPQVAVVSLEELATGKLRAALDRALPRDLFDTVRLPRLLGDTWLTSRFRRIHVAMAATLPHPLHRYARDRFVRVTDRSLREQLSPMLHVDEQPDAQSLQDNAWQVIAPLVTLDDAEREYIDRVQNGELCPELLFPDDEKLVGQLLNHPALLWKIDNIIRHKSR